MQKMLVLLSSWAPWITNNMTLILIIIGVIILIPIARYIIEKIKYKTVIYCTGYISRGGKDSNTKTVYHKNVPVKIGRKTGYYFFQDKNKEMRRLRKIHVDMINSTMNSKDGPEFDIPKKKEKPKPVIEKEETLKEKTTKMQTA